MYRLSEATAFAFELRGGFGASGERFDFPIDFGRAQGEQAQANRGRLDQKAIAALVFVPQIGLRDLDVFAILGFKIAERVLV